MYNDYVRDLFINAKVIAMLEEERKTRFTDDYENYDKKLSESLSPEQKQLFSDFKFYFGRHMFEIRDEDCMMTFYYGFHIGKNIEEENNRQRDF